LIGLVYAGLLEANKGGMQTLAHPSQELENLVFRETFYLFPLTLGVVFLVLIGSAAIFRAKNR
jgi:hypothetical protein